MAVIEPTITRENIHGQSLVVVLWDNITESDTCAPVKVAGFADKTIDINGTFGGGTMAIHGANHPTVPVYSALSDVADNALSSIGSNQVDMISQSTYWLKPVITGGTGMDINVELLAYRRV